MTPRVFVAMRSSIGSPRIVPGCTVALGRKLRRLPTRTFMTLPIEFGSTVGGVS
jgi:hypothetical protein